MESVSSCSPGASTSSASAAGACFPRRPSAFIAHPTAVIAKNQQPKITTETSLKPDLMPHARDERREPRQQLTSYYPQNSGGPATWNKKNASRDHWHTYRDHPVGQREAMIPYRLSSGMIRPAAQFDHRGMPSQHRSFFLSNTRSYGNVYEQRRSYTPNENYPAETIKKESSNSSGASRYRSVVAIPQNVIIPKEISPGDANADSSTEGSLGKRSIEVYLQSESSPSPKRSRGEAKEGHFDKLDLLCSATLELGPLLENPSGCSCPKSKCIALYCDCFKAGRRCYPDRCSCLNCKNTVEESGPNGARSKAIQTLLTRNPRAFTNAGITSASNKLPPGEQACNCIRSKCLKLYCTCFQKRKACSPGICTCVGCLNVEDDTSGMREMAIETTLEKRPDAFKQKSRTKILGAGCACKNNQCIRKYCECYRTSLRCTNKCSCKECKNRQL